MKRIPVLIFLCALFASANRAEVVIPSLLVQSYNVNEYDGSCQNWDITYSTYGGILYVANDEGLLVFDGNAWRTYRLPGRAIIKEIAFRNDTVFTRGDIIKGYWLNDSLGVMNYYPVDEFDDPTVFDKPKYEFPLPAEAIAAKPTAFATAGQFNFTGTETDGIYVSDDEGNLLLHLNNQNELPDNIVRNITVQDHNLIWVALDNGISQIDIDPPIRRLGKRSEIGRLEAAFLNDEILYVRTNLGYYKRTLSAADEFVPASAEEGHHYLSTETLGSAFTAEMVSPFLQPQGITVTSDNLYPAANNSFWVTRNNEAMLYQLENGQTNMLCRILLKNYGLNMITRGKQIFPLNESLYLFSATQGCYLVSAQRLIGTGPRVYNPPRFTRIEYLDKKGNLNLLPTTGVMVLPHNFRNFAVYVGTTIFTPIHQISYFIEGVSTEWSPWQRDGRIYSLQLPEGKYKLRIRKYVLKGDFPEITMQIEVRPPWYNTWWAFLIYGVIIVAIIRIFYIYNMRILRREENERLLLQQKEEKANMQRLKNEMLETELQNKNNELSLQTSALIKRNQAVQNLIEELDKQKHALGDRYPNKMYDKLRRLMEENINNQDNWILFESYFNSAHQNFLERLHQQYAELTPGDLRICCLLRMNLSSKEIASLMNISLRAVEIRRYRLRKRLELDADMNLVDFLMNF